VKYVPILARWNCWVKFDKGLGDKNVGDGVGSGVGDKVFEKFLRESEPNTPPLKTFNHKISNN